MNDNGIQPIKWLKDSWYLAKPYWTSKEKWIAISLVIIVIAFSLLNVYISVLFNQWNNVFYDTLQQFNQTGFYKALIKFGYLVFFSILFQIITFAFRKMLEIRWRRWMTKQYLSNWLTDHAYYKTRFIPNAADNPDQRISQDINSFIVTSLSLTLGLISNLVSLFSFVFILWHLSGNLTFHLGGKGWVINGYMVWVALLYAIIGTYLTFKIGRPLIRLSFAQEKVEANFRFGLMRVREYGENIAFYKTEEQEDASLLKKFNNVIDNFVSIVFRQVKIDILTTGYGLIASIFPLIVAAPRYFAKTIKLGDLTQIAGAFGHVQGSLSYFVDAYGSLASWRAVMDRLIGFQSDLSIAQKLPVVVKKDNSKSYLNLQDFELRLPDQTTILANNLNFNFNAGDRLLIRGNSGCGKTTFLKAIAGLWPFANGKIYQDFSKTELFVAQRVYLPPIGLKEAIVYPLNADSVSNEEISKYLASCSLSYLERRLNDTEDWGKTLSLGEQQRLAFARVLINKPDIVYLDEATSALDETMEAHLYQLLTKELPNSVIISVGHRSTLKEWHNQEYDFSKLQRA